MNKLLIVVVLILVVAGGMWWMGIAPFNKSAMPTTEGVTEKTNEATDTADTAIAANAVEIKDFAFSPKTLTVKAGTTVTFTNKDVTGHSATADDGTSFDTGVMSQGSSETVTFDKAGTFGYHCTPHPNMKATIVVE